MGRTSFPKLWGAALLLLLVGSVFAQEQPPAKDEPKQETTAPQQSAPSEDTKSSAQSEKQEQPAAQQEQTAQPSFTPQSASSTETAAPQAVQPQKEDRATCKKQAPDKPVPAKRKNHRKPTPPASTRKQPKDALAGKAAGQPGKVVVRNGGARSNTVQLSPATNQEQQLHNSENTAQLLATTDENLKRLAGKQLNPAQQSTLDQINTYVRQAKSAVDAGDLTRAHTLAYKAHLLSDDLARQ